MELLKQSLKEHYEDCMRMHTKCSAEVVAGPDGEEKDKVEKWAYDLDAAYTLVNEAVETYVAQTNAADEQSRKQKVDKESEERNARVAAENLIVQKLKEAEQTAAEAKAAAEIANKRAETSAEDHAASLIIIKHQYAALKRRHDQEDEEIARKRLVEDNERAELRRGLSASTTNPVQRTTNAALRISTPIRNVGFQDEFSQVDPPSTNRRYDTTGNGTTNGSPITNTVDAWIFQPFVPVAQTTGGGDLMMTMAMLAKVAFGGEARDWPMFIQTLKSMNHDVFPSDVQRLTMLSTMLVAPIREGMSQIFITPLAYRAALHELHRKYGHPHLVVRSYIQQLMAISLDEGGSNLETFSTQLNGAVTSYFMLLGTATNWNRVYFWKDSYKNCLHTCWRDGEGT